MQTLNLVPVIGVPFLTPVARTLEGARQVFAGGKYRPSRQWVIRRGHDGYYVTPADDFGYTSVGALVEMVERVDQ